MEKYIERVREQLECNATEEYKNEYIVYAHTNEVVDSNLEYFERCKEFGLSPYIALLFFQDYLNDDCDI